MSYSKQTWTNNVSSIDENKMNHIEDGIFNNSEAIGNIIKAGNDSNGNYVKFSDGTMICYGKKSITTDTSRSQGGLTYYSGYVEFDLPASFVNTNFVIMTSVEIENMNYFCNSFSSIKTKSSVRLSLTSTGNNDTRNVSYQAIGKWK